MKLARQVSILHYEFRMLGPFMFALPLLAAMGLSGLSLLLNVRNVDHGFISSLAIPVVLKVPVYQFLFVGYWFWANLMTPKIGLPSPVATMINAAGPYASEGLFNFQWTFLILHATVAQGIESVTLLVGLGLVGIISGWAYLRWQQAQQ